MSSRYKTQVTFYVKSKKDREMLIKQANSIGISMTMLINRSLDIGLPVVIKSHRDAAQLRKELVQKS
jgi:KaiC/GvpD/RAD55 family RecA-like ATPase